MLWESRMAVLTNQLKAKLWTDFVAHAFNGWLIQYSNMKDAKCEVYSHGPFADAKTTVCLYFNDVCDLEYKDILKAGEALGKILSKEYGGA